MTQLQRRYVLGLTALLAIAAQLYGQSSPQITAAELTKHVKFLASDQLEGRKAGSKGADAAAAYIANEFKSYGLKPLDEGGTYFQAFDFIAGIKLGSANSFRYSTEGKITELRIDSDYRPLGFSSIGKVQAGVAFAGYGISDSAKGYDDYAGLDVRGKAVLVMRNAPPSDSSGDFGLSNSLRFKASKARALGAKALIVVTGPEDSDTDDLIKLSYDNAGGEAGILVINVTRKIADEWLRVTNNSLKQLQKDINTSKKARSFSLGSLSVAASVDLKEIRQQTKNVIGMIEGSDPNLKDQVIVIGAHYDHLGWGGEGSGSLKPDTVAIHHGADDNASGTSSVLELAQAFAAEQTTLKRSLVFIAFSGEELGLLGSAYYVNHPLIPLERTTMMVNLDMVGRLRHKTLIIDGVGTSVGFEELLRKYNKDSTFALKLNKDGYGPSDYASFYGKKIPVLAFFTDVHEDYHRPSDTWDRVNYQGMEQVGRYVEAIAEDLDRSADKPHYVAVEVPRPASQGRSTTVSMGTIPDFGEQVQGFKLSGVREGGPAAKAGIIGGDIIIKFGKVDIKNIYDFMYALGAHKPDDEVDVVIKRGSETKTVRVKLERKN